MKTKFDLSGKLTVDKVIFAITVFVSLFWWLSQIFDVYYYKLIGIIFEILWLPAIASLFILPIISFIFWKKEKFTWKSYFPFSIILSVITVLTMILKS